jgi:hypothetical protein
LITALLLAAALAPAPLALHPDNPRYFLFRGELAVLVTSGERYGAVLNLDFDYVRYLDTLAADRLLDPLGVAAPGGRREGVVGETGAVLQAR